MNKSNIILSIIYFVSLYILIDILKINYIKTLFILYFVYIIIAYFQKEKIFNHKSLFIFSFCFITNLIIIRYAINLMTTNHIIIYLLLTIYNILLADITINESHLTKKIINLLNKLNSTYIKFTNIKYIKNISHFLPKNIFVIVILLITIFTIVSFNSNTKNDEISIYHPSITESEIKITDKTKIELPNINIEENFSNICFAFYPHLTKDAKLKLEVESKGRIIKKYNFRISKDDYYKEKCFKTQNINFKTLQNYTLYITPVSKTKQKNYTSLLKDNDDNTYIRLYKNQDNNFYIINTILIVSFLLIFLIINYLINTKKIPEKNYYLLMLFYMIPTIFIIPPYHTPDEVHHFNVAYNMSQYKIPKNNKSTISIPQNIECINYGRLHGANKVLSLDDINQCLTNSQNIQRPNQEYYSKIFWGYLPQTIGVKIADIVSNSPPIIFFNGRLINFIISFILIYLALKITPKHKTLFLTVATMMMFIQQMTSYSYDSVLNAVSLLYIAYLLKLYYGKEKINLYNLLLLTLMIFIIINIKIVYLPLALLLFIIPKEKFENNFKKILFISSIILLTLILLFITNSILYTTPTDVSTKPSQLIFILNNLTYIPKIFINTIDLKGMFYLQSLTGYFSWFIFQVNDIFIIIYIILFTYIILSEESKMTSKNKLALIISTLIMFLGILAAMYLFWSDYKLPYVEGVQGRYFIPLLLPFCISLIPNKRKFKANKKNIYHIINIILFQFVTILILWYY